MKSTVATRLKRNYRSAAYVAADCIFMSCSCLEGHPAKGRPRGEPAEGSSRCRQGWAFLPARGLGKERPAPSDHRAFRTCSSVLPLALPPSHLYWSFPCLLLQARRYGSPNVQLVFSCRRHERARSCKTAVRQKPTEYREWSNISSRFHNVMMSPGLQRRW